MPIIQCLTISKFPWHLELKLKLQIVFLYLFHTIMLFPTLTFHRWQTHWSWYRVVTLWNFAKLCIDMTDRNFGCIISGKQTSSTYFMSQSSPWKFCNTMIKQKLIHSKTIVSFTLGCSLLSSNYSITPN